MTIGGQLDIRENPQWGVGMIEGVIDTGVPMRFDRRPPACGDSGEQLPARCGGCEVVSFAH